MTSRYHKESLRIAHSVPPPSEAAWPAPQLRLAFYQPPGAETAECGSPHSRHCAEGLLVFFAWKPYKGCVYMRALGHKEDKDV